MINLNELTKQVQEISDATNHAKLLDEYQYLLCIEMEKGSDDRTYVKKLRVHRILALAYIVRLAEISEQIKADKTNQGLMQELVPVSRKMSQLIDKLEESVLE
ncbi:MAG: hypothetical protein M3297_13025 [Thermoproteota archaeon]|nr:hypothetical protein [Thermoproteota archaeon]